MIYNREDMIGQNLASKEGSEKNDSEISSIPQNKLNKYLLIQRKMLN